MNPFSEIRKAAQKKRDAAIKAARDQYDATLKRIAELEQDVTGAIPKDQRTIASCVNSLIPSDRTFTVPEIMAGLAALDEEREWRKDSVYCRLQILQRKGIIKCVKRSKSDSPAIYARMDLETEPLPFEGMKLVDVTESFLREQPMNTTELVVAMIEAGYETKMSKPTLKSKLGELLRADPTRFVSDGRKWALL